MLDDAKDIFTGIFILLLALLMWRTTGSFIGWLVMFLPGAFFVTWGLFKLWRDR